MFKKPLLIILSVVLVSSLVVCFQAESANQPLTVTRGGTGIDAIGEGYFIVGNTIDNMSATSSMSMDMLTGAVTIGEIVINSVTDGDLIVEGDIGIATSTPAENLVISSTASTTMYIDSSSTSLGGEIILQDTDGAGCSVISILDGTITSDLITCPY